MLRDDVVVAVAAGQFHIWTAERVDDTLELLTGVPAGDPDDAGVYPVGCLHRLVADRLARYAQELRTLSGDEDKSQTIR
jgi:hypothetical protein